ncbi:MAG: energy transducer TonB [Candidatus Aminicenantia bacterium]
MIKEQNKTFSQDLFRDSFIQGKKMGRRKFFVFPISLLIHSLILLGVIVIPLLHTQSLPELKVSNIILVPKLPSPPPPPPKSHRQKKAKDEIKIVKKETIKLGDLVAPVDIPDGISDEELSGFGVPNGVEGGIPGGVPGGVLEGIAGDIFKTDYLSIESPVRVIGEIKPPKLIKKVPPVYPEIAQKARVEGIVILEATTDIYGRVQHIKILRSIPLLDQAAIDAVKQWIYEPMIINGRPRGVIFTVTINFILK